jgi:hypothetical protein
MRSWRGVIIGGTVGGIGMALLEETLTDPGTGRIANATLGDYLIPVNADVPEMDVLFVGGPDPMTPIGTKGVGEIGLVGVDPGDDPGRARVSRHGSQCVQSGRAPCLDGDLYRQTGHCL